jgi:hypothetical protein
LVPASIIILLQQKENLEAFKTRFQADYGDRTTVFCQSAIYSLAQTSFTNIFLMLAPLFSRARFAFDSCLTLQGTDLRLRVVPAFYFRQNQTLICLSRQSLSAAHFLLQPDKKNFHASR